MGEQRMEMSVFRKLTPISLPDLGWGQEVAEEEMNMHSSALSKHDKKMVQMNLSLKSSI